MGDSILTDRIDGWYSSYQEQKTTSKDVELILGAENISYSQDDLMTLLSQEASSHLEQMAGLAKRKREQFFGNTIKLFTPVYISNYCSNGCRYCAFKADNKIVRKQLKLTEISKEIDEIKESSLRQVLILTGESKKLTTIDYMRDAISLFDKEFSSVAMEVYPMSQDEYEIMVDAGLDSLTVYQETYHREIYKYQHPYGEKANYDWRIDAPDRAAKAGVRAIQIGSLIGLDDFRRELGAVAIHLDYLSKRYPDVELSISIPRLRPIVGDELQVDYPISDSEFVQAVLAFRILFPHVGITLSTREDEKMRNGLIPLGVTKISAGVSTAVGGLSTDGSDEQFDIADERSVDEVVKWLEDNRFQPVFHDWNSRLTREVI